MKEDLPQITLSKGALTLLGFALKSKALSMGFEAARRSIGRQKTAIVLVDQSLAVNSTKKLQAIAAAAKVPILRVISAEPELALQSICGYKIVALHKGSITTGFLEKLNQEKQWQKP